MNLEGKIKKRVNQTARRAKPGQKHKPFVRAYPAGRKPAEDHARERRQQQQQADPPKRDPRFKPVIVQLLRPVG